MVSIGLIISSCPMGTMWGVVTMYGQGELKRGGFDPLFSLNHTAAMLRDRIKRLARRTWCTTKRLDRLQYLIDMYAFYHNESLNGLGRLIRI